MIVFSEAMIEIIWNKALVISGYDPNIWRQDFAGAWIRRDLYGVQHSYGWAIDHMQPKSAGGVDRLENLFPIQWMNNRKKGSNYPRFQTIVTSEGNHNIEHEESWIVEK